MPRGDLFPEIGPFETGYLPLVGGHVMYWEQVGNPRGRPVLFLHGGPGAGAGAVHRRFFDPRILAHHHLRPARRRPLAPAGRAASTTPRRTWSTTSRRCAAILGLERWLLFGGSWGSTLALAYAQAHPDRVIGCVLRGVFLGRPAGGGLVPATACAASSPTRTLPSPSFLPEAERGDLLGAYLRRLTDPDPAVHLPAARAWSVYEGSCCTLLPSPETVASFAQDRTALGLARIEAHYFAHDLFLPPEGLLAGMHRIAQLPAEIVQGRYDMICPPRPPSSWRRPGRRRGCRSCRMPGIRRWSRASAGAGGRGGAVPRTGDKA